MADTLSKPSSQVSKKPKPKLSLPHELWREIFSYNKESNHIDEHAFKNEEDFVEWHKTRSNARRENGFSEHVRFALWYQNDDGDISAEWWAAYLASDDVMAVGYREMDDAINEGGFIYQGDDMFTLGDEDLDMLAEDILAEFEGDEPSLWDIEEKCIANLKEIYQHFRNPVTNTIQFDKSDVSEEKLMGLRFVNNVKIDHVLCPVIKTNTMTKTNTKMNEWINMKYNSRHEKTYLPCTGDPEGTEESIYILKNSHFLNLKT